MGCRRPKRTGPPAGAGQARADMSTSLAQWQTLMWISIWMSLAETKKGWVKGREGEHLMVFTSKLAEQPAPASLLSSLHQQAC